MGEGWVGVESEEKAQGRSPSAVSCTGAEGSNGRAAWHQRHPHPALPHQGGGGRGGLPKSRSAAPSIARSSPARGGGPPPKAVVEGLLRTQCQSLPRAARGPPP